MEDPSSGGLEQELLGESEPVKGRQALSRINSQPVVAPLRDCPDIGVLAERDLSEPMLVGQPRCAAGSTFIARFAGSTSSSSTNTWSRGPQ